MTYKFVTWEDLHALEKTDRLAFEIQLTLLAVRLLAERDAYREAYAKRIHDMFAAVCDCSAAHDIEERRKEADEEAARIIAQTNGLMEKK